MSRAVEPWVVAPWLRVVILSVLVPLTVWVLTVVVPVVMIAATIAICLLGPVWIVGAACERWRK